MDALDSKRHPPPYPFSETFLFFISPLFFLPRFFLCSLFFLFSLFISIFPPLFFFFLFFSPPAFPPPPPVEYGRAQDTAPQREGFSPAGIVEP